MPILRRLRLTLRRLRLALRRLGLALRRPGLALRRPGLALRRLGLALHRLRLALHRLRHNLSDRRLRLLNLPDFSVLEFQFRNRLFGGLFGELLFLRIFLGFKSVGNIILYEFVRPFLFPVFGFVDFINVFYENRNVLSEQRIHNPPAQAP